MSADEGESWLERAIGLYDSDMIGDGDIITHEWLAYALDIPPVLTLDDVKRVQWATLERVDAFRDHMLETRRIALRSIRGHGYQVVPPGQQAEYAADVAMTAARKGIERGQRLIRYARTERMTAAERRRHTDTGVRLAAVNQMLTRERKDVFALFAPRQASE